MMLVFVILFPPIAAAISVAGTLAVGPVLMLPVVAGVVAALALIGTVSQGFDVVQGSILLNVLFFGGSVGVAALLAKTRSLSFTLQLMALAMVAALLVGTLMIGDLVSFWRPVIEDALQMLTQTGAVVAEVSGEQREALIVQFAQIATAVVGASFWYCAAIALVVGHWIWSQSPSATASFGRFRDINLGRTIATVMLVTAILSALLPVTVLGNVALALMLVFGFQGIAIVHWQAAERQWNGGLLVLFYGLLVMPTPLQPLLVGVVCVAGYVDAWFNLLRTKPSGAVR